MHPETQIPQADPQEAPRLVVRGGQVRATSLDVAEHFGRQHKNVLRDIQALECSAEFNELNFAPIDYIDDRGRTQPMYEMTRDGFVFLVMGFTGREAARWKEAYIRAFNTMEAELRGTVEEAGAALSRGRIEGFMACLELIDSFQLGMGDLNHSRVLDIIWLRMEGFTQTQAAKAVGLELGALQKTEKALKAMGAVFPQVKPAHRERRRRQAIVAAFAGRTCLANGILN